MLTNATENVSFSLVDPRGSSTLNVCVIIYCLLPFQHQGSLIYDPSLNWINTNTESGMIGESDHVTKARPWNLVSWFEPWPCSMSLSHLSSHVSPPLQRVADRNAGWASDPHDRLWCIKPELSVVSPLTDPQPLSSLALHATIKWTEWIRTPYHSFKNVFVMFHEEGKSLWDVLSLISNTEDWPLGACSLWSLMFHKLSEMTQRRWSSRLCLQFQSAPGQSDDFGDNT